MAICIFTFKATDGSGDVIHAVKIADFIQRFIESSKVEELKNEAVIIVVPEDQGDITVHTKEIASRFVQDINSNIQVKKMSELKEENHQINCCIVAAIAGAYFSFFFASREEENAFLGRKLPKITMDEYDHENPGIKIGTKILGGFIKDRGDVGVIPNRELLDATAGEEISPDVLQSAFERLDPKIQSYLGKHAKPYMDQHDFTYHYGNEKVRTGTFFTNSTPYKPYQEASKQEITVVDDTSVPTHLDLFLQEHVMLMGNSAKSQDVLCIGKNSEAKLQALTKIKDDLILKGYTKVSFIDIDTKDEKVIYEDSNPRAQKKEYRVLYSKSMPFSSMQVLPLIATDIVGVTGDQSLVEAMSAKKLVSYECVQHKYALAQGYVKSVQNEASEMALEENLITDVSLLALFLIKPTRGYAVEYKAEEVSRLLSNRKTVETLKNINRQLVAKSQYFASIEKMLMSEVLPYIVRQKHFNDLKEHKLADLVYQLSDEVFSNETNSDRWNKRRDAANKLVELIKDNKISQKDASLVTTQLAIIKQNEPSWHECYLITKILDILSLGLNLLIKRSFFTSDKTMAYVAEIEELNILSP
jgi:hypothetical protein